MAFPGDQRRSSRANNGQGTGSIVVMSFRRRVEATATPCLHLVLALLPSTPHQLIPSRLEPTRYRINSALSEDGKDGEEVYEKGTRQERTVRGGVPWKTASSAGLPLCPAVLGGQKRRSDVPLFSIGVVRAAFSPSRP